MKGTLPALTVLVMLSLPSQAERLSPTPEPGLWRSESRVLSSPPGPTQRHVSVQNIAELSTTEYRALLDTAVSRAPPDVVMECIPLTQAAELGQLFTLQKIIQRKLPGCDLSLQKINRSALKVFGNCHAQRGFSGPLHGLVEFVSSHEIHASFLGNNESHTSDGVPLLTALPNLQRHEVHRWASPDCGDIRPQERISF